MDQCWSGPDEAPRVMLGRRGLKDARIGVFIDYWYVYATARQLFAPPGVAPPPAWFGNVPPAALAHRLVKRPPKHTRRSQRVLGGTHVFVRHVDPLTQPTHLMRIRQWQEAGVIVHIGPSRDVSPGHSQGTLNVDLACAVTRALDLATYDIAVIFSGDAALYPMFQMDSDVSRPLRRLELATWVGPDGSVPNGLITVRSVWCHRLGNKAFRALLDDRVAATPRERARARRQSGADYEPADVASDRPAPPSVTSAAETGQAVAHIRRGVRRLIDRSSRRRG